MEHANREDTTEEAADFSSLFFSPSPNPLLNIGAATHVGLVREKNEDHFLTVCLDRSARVLASSVPDLSTSNLTAHAYSLVVADGMGGMRSGELASRIALQTMLELVGEASSWVMKLEDFETQQIEQRVQAYVKRVHAAIRKHAAEQENSDRMGTTWTSAHVVGDQVVVVHIGDSRAYLLRGTELTQLTHDETLAQSLIDTGLDSKQVSHLGHILLNSLGGGAKDPYAAICQLRLRPEDRLLLCSDGLTGQVTDDAIVELLTANVDPQLACDRLIDAALAAGGRDNVTAIVTDVTFSPEG